MVHLEVLQYLTHNLNDFDKHILDIEQNDLNAAKLGNFVFFAHVADSPVDKVIFEFKIVGKNTHTPTQKAQILM